MHTMNEMYELAMKICGFDPDNDEDFEKAQDEVEQILWDKYNITEESFEDLMPNG